YLEAQGEQMPRLPSGQPFVPPAMPNYDDEELGYSFFRMGVADADYNNLTLPRTFFGRSLLARASFTHHDLSESRICWNDFEGCDFTGADLSGCDMRSSNFKGCKFVGTVLRGADFRRASFEDCDFTGADVTGAVAEVLDSVGCPRDYLSED